MIHNLRTQVYQISISFLRCILSWQNHKASEPGKTSTTAYGPRCGSEKRMFDLPSFGANPKENNKEKFKNTNKKGEDPRLKPASIRAVALFVCVLEVAGLERRGAVGGDAALDVGGVCGFGEEDGAVVSGSGEGGVLVGGMRGFWGWGGGGGTPLGQAPRKEMALGQLVVYWHVPVC